MFPVVNFLKCVVTEVVFVFSYCFKTFRGAGTNLKVGEGAPIRRKVPEKYLVVPLYFLALKAQLVILVSALVMVSTVW